MIHPEPPVVEKPKQEEKKEKKKPEKVTTEVAQPIPSPEGNANQVVKQS
jgi:hypothetical protein